jgi:probable selenium-dependent hydroxylase accessory protein YqeC/molybdenum cofactor cytidylyltransferase
VLYRRFNINPDKKELIALVGGGGKTTTMFRLAKELKRLNKRVLVTTTTAIYYPDNEEYDEIIVSDLQDLNIFKDMKIGSITVLGRDIIKDSSQQSKLKGVEKSFIDDVYKSGIFDFIIVEADGSKRKPIKAPADHEPVIPACSIKAIGVIGMDCFGKRIDDNCVHRPERLCSLTKKEIGNLIDEEVIIKLIANEIGLFKGVPKGCEKYLMLNKVDSLEREGYAKKVIKLINESNFEINGLVVGSVIMDRFIDLSCKNKITGIILASGFSRRMNKEKLTLKVEGVPVVERVIKAAANSKIDDIILVYQNEEVKKIGEKYGIKTIYNERAVFGQSEAVKLGVKFADSKSKGYIFLVGDQPFITSNIINRLIHEFNIGEFPIIAPSYHGKRGNPIIFSSSLKDEIMKLEGDKGGRTIIENMKDNVKLVEINETAAAMDIDTEEEYKRIQELEMKKYDK